MEYGQQMQQAKDNAMMAFYQNPGYQLERRNKKTFILKVDSDGTIHFNEPLHEPLIIDSLSDICLYAKPLFINSPIFLQRFICFFLKVLLD